MRLTLLIATCVGFLSYSQETFKKVQLPLPKGATYPFSQIEPSIAINPNNPKMMVAGSVLSDYYYSRNGGKTWKSHTLESKYGVYGDPVLMFDNHSKIYYFHLASFKETTHLDRIVCQTAQPKRCSAKSMTTFNEGAFPKPNGTKVQDKHWFFNDTATTEIYTTWTQFDAYNSSKAEDSSIIVFSKSSDQGETWSVPKRISAFAGDCLDDDNTVEGAVPAVGPNGELYVTWTGPKGLVFQKSMDGGETWLKEEKLIEDHIGGWTLKIPGIYRANGLPILKCDLSNGPNRGTLYLNWCDQRNGEDDTDSWIMTSKDGGDSWSEPVKVNQDDPGSHQFFTWMSIDQSNGYLYFVYYDRRNHDDINTDVYLSVSRDGGKTFTDTKISDTPFVPNDGIFFGDYLNIDVVDGIIRPIWPRMDNDKMSLWVALINEDQLMK
jgi:hypothetical protein